MKLFPILILLFTLTCVHSYGQRYKNGGVSIINAKGQNWDESYHKIQLGINLPSSMSSKRNIWYWEPRDSFNTGLLPYPSFSLQYAWSSNANTEFIIHSDYELIKYYHPFIPKQIEHSRHFVSLLVGVNYKWWNHNDISLYSGLMLGGVYGKYAVMKTDQEDITLNTDRDNIFLPTAQLTLLGFSYGRRLGIFGELALGTRGLFTGGLYLKL